MKLRIIFLSLATVAALVALDCARRINESSPTHGDSVATPTNTIQLCQALSPAAPHPIWGVDSAAGCGCGEVGWDSRGSIPWQCFAQGEYVGDARIAHVAEYRLRAGDKIAVFYLRTREVINRPYELQVGDQIQVESLTAGRGATGLPGTSATGVAEDTLNRSLVVQPDGMITLPLIGRVIAAGRQIEALRDDLEEKYKTYYKVPAITVTPLVINTKLEDLLDTVDSRGGIQGGYQISVVVTPAGTLQLPGIGSVFVQGLSLPEAKLEIDSRYEQRIPGVHVTVDLLERAQRFVYVLGEVNNPGRFTLEAPTTAMMALALAGDAKIGANRRQIVVFRRGHDWRMLATMLDLQGALYGRRPVPADDIWLNDSDIVLVPKNILQIADEAIEQVFTRGLYSAVPQDFIWGLNAADSSSL
ncbi:MAG: polysaccharide biosynthesis/export family protein [Pirellulales bacterium]